LFSRERGHRLSWLEAEKRSLQNSPNGVGAREPDENAGANHPKRIAQHHPNHIAGSGAQCHSNSDFVGPASHGVGEQTAESNGCES
jgi:hypothetical protein